MADITVMEAQVKALETKLQKQGDALQVALEGQTAAGARLCLVLYAAQLYAAADDPEKVKEYAAQIKAAADHLSGAQSQVATAAASGGPAEVRRIASDIATSAA